MPSSSSSFDESLAKRKNKMLTRRPFFMQRLSSSLNHQDSSKTEEVCYTNEGKNQNNNNKNLSKVIRQLVWNKYIGERNGLGKCWCCRNKTISSFEFEAGHVVARANGGEDTVENLRPICSLCNKSMGKENMIEYQKRQNLGPTTAETLWENFLNVISYIPLRFGW